MAVFLSHGTSCFHKASGTQVVKTWLTITAEKIPEDLSHSRVTNIPCVETDSQWYNLYIWCRGNATTKFKELSHGDMTVTLDMVEIKLLHSGNCAMTVWSLHLMWKKCHYVTLDDIKLRTGLTHSICRQSQITSTLVLTLNYSILVPVFLPLQHPGWGSWKKLHWLLEVERRVGSIWPV